MEVAVSKDMCGSVKKGSGAHPERTCAQSVEIDVTWKASSPKVVVVVPTYNEVANLDKLVQRISDLDIQNLKILFVDDGSPDGTGEAVERLAKKYEGDLFVKKLWWNPHDPQMEEITRVAGEQGVTSSPFFILYENGEIVKSGYGFPDEKGEGMEDFLKGVLSDSD